MIESVGNLYAGFKMVRVCSSDQSGYNKPIKQIKKIQQRLKASLSKQKSYADQRRRPLEFFASDHVFLRLTPFTSVGRVIRSKKLTLKFIGPYQFLRRIGPIAYELALPPPLVNIHNIFHVSQLRKYVPNPSQF